MPVGFCEAHLSMWTRFPLIVVPRSQFPFPSCLLAFPWTGPCAMLPADAVLGAGLGAGGELAAICPGYWHSGLSGGQGGGVRPSPGGELGVW